MNTAATYWARIYLAGDVAMIRQVCRQFCYRGVTDPAQGLCVNVQPCDFIYTGGEESGACVELIQYPRFPAPEGEILAKARALAEELRTRCCQRSVLIMTPEMTEWLDGKD